MRLALATMVMCAGCDALFNLDHVQGPATDARGDGSIDAMVDAPERSHTFVQATSTTSTTSLAVFKLYSFAQTAGNLNVVFIGWTSSGSQVMSVTDTAGNIYTAATGQPYGGRLGQVVYYAPNIKGGTNTVTVQFNQSTTGIDVRLLEYSGVSTTDPLDATAQGVSTGMLATTGTFNTTAAHTIVIAGFFMSGIATGAGSGCTQRIITGDGNLVEDFEKFTAGPSEATAPQNQNGAYIGQAVSFSAP